MSGAVQRSAAIAAAVLATILIAAPSQAATLVYQVSDVSMSGIFFSVSGGGQIVNNKPNLSLTETGPGFSYNYDWTGADLASQHPPTLCFLAGCDPFGGPVPGSPEPFSFSLNGSEFPTQSGQTTTVSGGGEDDLELYSGTAQVTLLASGTPEPTAWAMFLVGLGAIGAALRRSRQAGARTPMAVPPLGRAA